MGRGLASNRRDDRLDKKMLLKDKASEARALGLSIGLYPVYKKATEGDPDSTFMLAQAYYTGKRAVRSLDKAFDLYKKAAELGNVNAQCTLGCLYYTGECGEQSDELAFKWLNRAAYYDYPRAKTSLATLYANGRGCEQNVRMEYQLLKDAASKGYEPAVKRFNEKFSFEKQDELAILAEMPMPEPPPAPPEPEPESIETVAEETVEEVPEEEPKREEPASSTEHPTYTGFIRYDYTAMLTRVRERRKRRKFRSSKNEDQTRLDDFDPPIE